MLLRQVKKRLETIRESERKSHTGIYTQERLYETDSWRKSPWCGPALRRVIYK